MSKPANNDPLQDSSIDQHPLAQSKEPKDTVPSTQEFIVTSTRIKLSADEVLQDAQGLQRLMKNGSWRSVIKLSDKLLSTTKFPHDRLQLRLCRMLALVKIRNYKSASDELELIGDFEAKENWYENYPELYPKMKGCMIPFSLKLIKAELPFFLKTASGLPSLDPLYELLDICRKEIANLKNNEKTFQQYSVTKLQFADSLSPIPSPSTPLPNLSSISDSLSIEDIFCTDYDNTLSAWQERETKIVLSIATHLVQEKEFPLTILLLQDLLQKNPNDPALLSSLGRVHLQFGNIKAASAVFKQVESLITEKAVLYHMNRGFLALSMDQYNAAIDHFQGVLDLDPNNLVAANNKAICLLYKCELSRAIAVLEELIRKDPERNLHETVVFNLCTLYDLKSDTSTDKKRGIMNLVAKFGSDSFDLTVLKLN